MFCEILCGIAPAKVVSEWDDAIAFVPLCPVTDGHVLVIPRIHFRDHTEATAITAAVAARAAEWARQYPSSNLIMSAGEEATQSVFHLHVHVIPRRADDQLMVPWGTLHGEDPKAPHRCKGMVEMAETIRRLAGA